MSNNERPSWLLDHGCTDTEIGVLRSGKEAQIEVVERSTADGRTALLARKRYLPRKVENKGELQRLGVQRASTFRHDAEYREGRQFRRTRERRAVERMTAYGKKLVQSRWTSHEHTVVEQLWRAGMAVPYPVSFGDEVFTLQYLGDRDTAAPRLAEARLDPDQLVVAAEQLMEGLDIQVRVGWVHGDLSAYNLLWWQEQLWFIDYPQAVDLAANPQGLNYLHRDLSNVCDWFARQGHDLDVEALFAELLGSTPGW